ncbi:histidine kinase N-terminal 7TM domain-containing protein [Niallia sp. NCCP-28]|uniref:histidine kinase N-terminal 7TM domain-containing diguanylate cyclase n=1 Tax=Niallia sp. NCCP-28 TaxID=2934712 RepID=UPI002085B31A|nr:histidine kinase N-terminal 7TM domain-containing protein [Niallia sp. NCCP-28]GKU84544.1 GGDEF domain-containing protein [Niallia sp. NCCP-28]
MDQFLQSYIALMCTAGVLQVILAIIAFHNRQVFEGTKTFVWLSVFSAIYSFGHAIELTSTTIDGIMFWVVFQYLGMPFSAPATLILVLQYINLDKLVNKKTLILFYFIPAISFLLISTNHLHHLFYKTVGIKYVMGAPLLDMTVGQWYVVHGSYTFGTLFIGAVLLIWYWTQTKSKHWKQVITLIIGILSPITASFLYLMGLTPRGIDPVPIVMLFTSMLYLWAILSTHWLKVAPIAKENIFESMSDGVIVVDLLNKVVDFNSIAGELYTSLKDGINLNELKGLDKKLGSLLINKSSDPITAETAIHLHNELKHFQVKISPVLKHSGERVGNIIVFMDITERARLQLQLKELAYKDSLTGIYNRSYFYKKAEKLTIASIELGEVVSFILFDIDHFKNINDNYGHAYGDEAIKHVVSIAKEALGDKGIVGRYGGEEFMICMPGFSAENVEIFANRLRADIEEKALTIGMDTIKITASLGITVLKSKDAFYTVDELIAKADRALYRAKNNGRNAVCIEEDDQIRDCLFLSSK